MHLRKNKKSSKLINLLNLSKLTIGMYAILHINGVEILYKTTIEIGAGLRYNKNIKGIAVSLKSKGFPRRAENQITMEV